jgi:predicted transcriptional regulator
MTWGGRRSETKWYRSGTIAGMAMNLRLSDDEADALRRKAAEEGRSMQEVARSAIADYVTGRPERLRAAIEKVRTEDAELLDRLGR